MAPTAVVGEQSQQDGFSPPAKTPREEAGRLGVYGRTCTCARSDARIQLPLGPLAQLVEQLTLNQQVQGSSPWRLTFISFMSLCLYLTFYSGLYSSTSQMKFCFMSG